MYTYMADLTSFELLRAVKISLYLRFSIVAKTFWTIHLPVRLSYFSEKKSRISKHYKKTAGIDFVVNFKLYFTNNAEINIGFRRSITAQIMQENDYVLSLVLLALRD